VSDIQERQLTTWDKILKRLKWMAFLMIVRIWSKKRFLDESYNIKNLTSANSINIARWFT
jgi:threonine synthase